MVKARFQLPSGCYVVDCESAKEDLNCFKIRILTRISEVLRKVSHFRVFATTKRKIPASRKI